MKRVLIATLFLTTKAWALEPINFAGCAEADYVTLAAGIASTVIAIDGIQYSPKCIKVTAGTEVTISAHRSHPLQGAADFNGVANPFRTEGSESKVAQKRVLTQPGFYGYFCTNHGDSSTGEGMGGVIWVVEAKASAETSRLPVVTPTIPTNEESCITGIQCTRTGASGHCHKFEEFKVCGNVCETSSICGHVKHAGTNFAKCTFYEDEIKCGKESCTLVEDCADGPADDTCNLPEMRVQCQ